MVIICGNFTLSEVEMPHLRHLRAFKTASSLKAHIVISSEARNLVIKTRTLTLVQFEMPLFSYSRTRVFIFSVSLRHDY